MTIPAIVMAGDTARVRRRAPLTSHRAADASAVRVGSSHEAVLRVLEDATTPLTEERIVARAKECPINARCSDSRLRSAVPELVRRRMVRKASEGSGETAAGNPADTYELASDE